MKQQIGIMLVLLGGILLTGCANQRFYCGFDDYGQTQRMNNQWQTGPEVQHER